MFLKDVICVMVLYCLCADNVCSQDETTTPRWFTTRADLLQRQRQWYEIQFNSFIQSTAYMMHNNNLNITIQPL